MDQSDLRALEDQCIQEHAPACAAGCPVRVDGRSLCAEAAKGDFTNALKVFRKAVPFPGIISHICNEPCRQACIRKDAGEAISLARVERAAVDFAEIREKLPPLPRRGKRAAIIGGSLCGLTAACDLARKGYGVTLYEKEAVLGGSLNHYPESVLPKSVIQADLAVLAELNVNVNLNSPVDRIESGENGQFLIHGERFDAVYLATGSPPAPQADINLSSDQKIIIDPLTYAASREGIFAGGGCTTLEERSPIWYMSDGRRASTSMDRYLQRVSMTASRILEGVYATRLFTSLTGIAPLPTVSPASAEAGYTRAEAVQEAQRCIQCQCLECVKVCEYLKQYGSYPKRYLREVYNNLSIVKGERIKNQFINSCSLCGLCGEVCPTDLNMRTVFRDARRSMVDTKRMPASAHDFALRDMAFSNSDKFALSRSQAGQEKSRYVFFPGCQLSASAPHEVEQIYGYLVSRSTDELRGGVGLALRCCGAPAEWAGETALFDASRTEFLAEYHKLGDPELILACSSCFSIFKTYYPEVKISSLWTLLDRIGLPEGVQAALPGKTIAVHDPCTTRYESEIQDSIRSLLGKLGYVAEELPLSRERTECCSYGGLMWLANPKLAHDVIQRRIAESPLAYVTYCAMCRDFFARQGKPTLHVLDLLYAKDPLEITASRRGPDYSDRHENRARLKNRMLHNYWREPMEPPKKYESISLILSDDIRRMMEERMILVEDIQQVIEYTERTGMRLFNKDTGHYLTHYTPSCVTYWVEFAPKGDSFEVFNTYSHRMVIMEQAQK
jgi:NADPH-dependent glutamate synthase beta subunit-like oxidoreductase